MHQIKYLRRNCCARIFLLNCAFLYWIRNVVCFLAIDLTNENARFHSNWRKFNYIVLVYFILYVRIVHSQKIKRIKTYFPIDRPKNISAYENFVGMFVCIAFNFYNKSNSPDVFQPPWAHSFDFRSTLPSSFMYCAKSLSEMKWWQRTYFGKKKKRRKHFCIM